MDGVQLLFKLEKVNYSNYIYRSFNDINEMNKSADGDMDMYYRDITRSIRTKKGVFKLDKLTNTEEDFVNNFTNILSTIRKDMCTLVIEQKDKNISIKLYEYSKSRGRGSKYFKVRRTLQHITFNFKTKRFYGGIINRKNKKLINSRINYNLTSISQSSFKHKILGFIRNIYEPDNSGFGDRTTTKYSEIFNIFFEVIAQKNGFILDKSLSPDKNLFLLYLKLNNIKYPDSFFNYVNLYFKKSDLKPFKMNLVNYVMSLYDLKGDNIRKILNSVNNFIIYDVVTLYRVLGVDYFNKITNLSIFASIEQPSYWMEYYSAFNRINGLELTNIERGRLVNIINEFTYSEQLTTIFDHIDFKQQLKKYEVNVKVKSKNYHDFVVEHEEWSKLLISYRSGTIVRFYGDDSHLIEEPIKLGDDIFYPKLLTNSSDYEEESRNQRNCVRTYSEKPYCMIISLRKGDMLSEQRLTIEYQFRRNEIVRVQTKERFNMEVKNEWLEVIEILDSMVSEYYKQDVINLPKITKTFGSGVTFVASAVFYNEDDDDEFTIRRILPVWDRNIGDEVSRYDYIYDIDELP